MNRRRRHSLLALGLVLTIFGGAVAYELLRNGPRNPIGDGPYFRRASETSIHRAPGGLTFLAVGDTGSATHERDAVAALMTSYVARDAVQFVLLLGDNFYPQGVDEADSPRFDEDFESAYPVAGLPLPFHIVLGNHDHQGSITAQVEHRSPSGRWILPAPFYRRAHIAPDGTTVDVLMLDTMPLLGADEDAASQLAWLRSELAASRADWRIVAGHHPMHSGGVHGGCARLRDRLRPILLAAGVALYLCGHDHDLQVLESHPGLLEVVSGAGSILRPAGKVRETLYSESTAGFAEIQVHRDGLYVRMISEAGVRFEAHVDRRQG